MDARLQGGRIGVLGMVLLAFPVAAWSRSGGVGGLGGSAVGYVENAIPATYLRLRNDAAFESNKPNRAEYFYAIGQKIGPGLPRAEREADYQEVSLYGEWLVAAGLSVFVDAPWRFLAPEINDHHDGIGDVTIGGKLVLSECNYGLLTGLLRVTLPTGDSEKGLGTNHYSVESGLLGFQRLSDTIALEGELRFWQPFDGTDGYEGSILRYGLGVQYTLCETCQFAVTPVFEVVGWTVLNGRSRFLPDVGLPIVDEDASGDTIVNAKFGVRIRFEQCADFYAGYGQVVTDEKWYENVFRLEFRVFF